MSERVSEFFGLRVGVLVCLFACLLFVCLLACLFVVCLSFGLLARLKMLTAWLGLARLGSAWLGLARLGSAWLGLAWLGLLASLLASLA